LCIGGHLTVEGIWIAIEGKMRKTYGHAQDLLGSLISRRRHGSGCEGLSLEQEERIEGRLRMKEGRENGGSREKINLRRRGVRGIWGREKNCGGPVREALFERIFPVPR
jgi:hypothetical protein